MKQKYLTPADRKKLLDHLDSAPATAIVIALRVILRTGCRTEELLKLSVDCIDLVNETIAIIPAKGSEVRHIPLSKYMINSVYSLLKLHGSFSEAICNGSNSSCKRSIRRAWKKHVFRALGPGYQHTSPHSARSSFAVNIYLNAGHDVLLVQELLGHKALSSTQHYVKMSRALDRAKALKKVIG